MKTKLAILLIAVVVLLAATLYLRFGGVPHERIVEAVADGTHEVKDRIDSRCAALDRKLDRIESKLDRLLEIANRPLPDGLQRADEPPFVK